MKFSLILLAVVGILASSVFAEEAAKASQEPAESAEKPEQINQFIRGSEDMIAAVYRRAISQAVDTKVKELQTAISTGDNVVPVALDILKLTLLSNPTQLTIRKTAEHIINIMSPEAKKVLNTVMLNPAMIAANKPNKPSPAVEEQEEPTEKPAEVVKPSKQSKFNKKNSI